LWISLNLLEPKLIFRTLPLLLCVAPVHRRAAGGKEESDAGHVGADAEPAQPAQDDGNEEEGDVEHVAADAG